MQHVRSYVFEFGALKADWLNSYNDGVSNISKMEREAIVSLRKNNNIVVFEADKGGAVVVMNKPDYITDARNHLNSVDADGNRI